MTQSPNTPPHTRAERPRIPNFKRFLITGAVLGFIVGAAVSIVGDEVQGYTTTTGALYIGAQFGPGPRDGLMTGLVRRTGLSVRLVRTAIELTVLATGFLLGGSIGVGTVVYALSIGPLVHVLLPIFTVRLKRE